jgi:hypothetical protein
MPRKSPAVTEAARFPIDIVIDKDASPSNLTEALAALIVERAWRVVRERAAAALPAEPTGIGTVEPTAAKREKEQ